MTSGGVLADDKVAPTGVEVDTDRETEVEREVANRELRLSDMASRVVDCRSTVG